MVLPEKSILLLQTALWYIIFILGTLVAVPTGVTTRNFNGVCILYAQLIQTYSSGGSVSLCNFVTYSHVIFGMMYAAGMAMAYSALLARRYRKGDRNLNQKDRMWLNIMILILNFVGAIVIVSASCVLGIGFRQFCASLLKYAGENDIGIIRTCQDAQKYYRWDQHTYGGSFFTALTIATVSGWIGIFAWLLQLSLNFLLVHIHRSTEEKKTYMPVAAKRGGSGDPYAYPEM